ncbi:MAG TPA: rhodanese-like domain-containing protein [Thermoanaerobaculia bacterium]|nr:rhodanese-like domain-containing protein [Thermoanaerobaculia bacterium]
MTTAVETAPTQTASRVLAHPAASREEALAHFRAKLAFETDPSDVWADLEDGATGFLVIDARIPEVYAAGHVPGAINLPHRTIDAATTAGLPKDKVIVTYCDGVGCNASTKAAVKLSALGFAVKEMLGGLDWWRRDGLPLATGAETGTPGSAVLCGC